MAAAQPEADQAPPASSATIEQIFAAHESPLLFYARGLVADPDVAQDLVQEAFMKLHLHFASVRQPRPWLYRTVHNLALNHHRAGRKIVSLDGEAKDCPRAELVDPEPPPDQQIEHLEAIGHACRCLETLEQRQQELVRLKFEEGLSYKEMSARTGLSVGHVGYLLHHALKSLARQLEQSGVSL